MIRVFCVLLMLLYAVPAHADVPLSLTGQAVAGGLLFGKTVSGAAVRLDGKDIPVSADGDFLLGFGRDEAGVKRLDVRTDGAVLHRDIQVAERTFDIERIDGLPQREVTPDPADLARIQKESVEIAQARTATDPVPAYLGGFVWPADGRISGVYGSQRILNGEPKRPHYGTDIAAPEGAPVRAVAGGRVAFTHPGMFFNGKMVLIDHGLGLRSVYIHVSGISVHVGQQIRAGDVIGAVGATGRATGPHLHFGLELDQTPIDAEVVLAGPPPG